MDTSLAPHRLQPPGGTALQRGKATVINLRHASGAGIGRALTLLQDQPREQTRLRHTPWGTWTWTGWFARPGVASFVSAGEDLMNLTSDVLIGLIDQRKASTEDVLEMVTRLRCMYWDLSGFEILLASDDPTTPARRLRGPDREAEPDDLRRWAACVAGDDHDGPCAEEWPAPGLVSRVVTSLLRKPAHVRVPWGLTRAHAGGWLLNDLAAEAPTGRKWFFRSGDAEGVTLDGITIDRVFVSGADRADELVLEFGSAVAPDSATRVSIGYVPAADVLHRAHAAGRLDETVKLWNVMREGGMRPGDIHLVLDPILTEPAA